MSDRPRAITYVLIALACSTTIVFLCLLLHDNRRCLAGHYETVTVSVFYGEGLWMPTQQRHFFCDEYEESPR